MFDAEGSTDQTTKSADGANSLQQTHQWLMMNQTVTRMITRWSLLLGVKIMQDKFQSELHAQSKINVSSEGLKTSFIYYLADQIYAPKKTGVYNYHFEYRQLKSLVLPKKLATDIKELRANWPMQVESWIKEIWPEVMQFACQRIAGQDLPSAILESIQQELANSKSTLSALLHEAAEDFSDERIKLDDFSKKVRSNPELNELLRERLLRVYLEKHKEKFNLSKSNIASRLTELYTEYSHRTMLESPHEDFLISIKEQLKKSFNPNLTFEFSYLERLLGVTQDITNRPAIKNTTREILQGAWNTDLSDDNKKLIKFYSVCDVLNKFIRGYDEFMAKPDEQGATKELYDNNKILFTELDQLIEEILTEFSRLMLAKRNALVNQVQVCYQPNDSTDYVTLLPTGHQFAISSREELLASFQVSVRSFRRAYKGYLREVYFYPFFNMQKAIRLEERSGELQQLKNISYLPNTATYNYYLKGFGTVPVNFSMTNTGVLNPYVPDFGQYQDDIKIFEALTQKGLSSSQFFQWLDATYRVKSNEVNLQPYVDNVAQQQMLMRKLAIFTICLFMVEGIRNRAVFATNLLNLQFLIQPPKEAAVQENLSIKLTQYFPMTEKEMSNTGRSLDYSYSPNHNSPLGNKVAAYKQDDLKTKQNKALERVNCATFAEVVDLTEKSMSRFLAKTHLAVPDKTKETKNQPVHKHKRSLSLG